MFIARNILFYPGFHAEDDETLRDHILVPNYYLNRMIEEFNDGEPMSVTLTNVDTDDSVIVLISGAHTEDKNTIYVPHWILTQIRCTGECDTPVRVKKSVEDLPIATKIVIKPFSPELFDIDILKCFETTLSILHTIKEGIVIPVYVKEPSIHTMAYIEKVEPEPLCKIVNGEVNVDFINMFEEPPTIEEPPTVEEPPTTVSDEPVITDTIHEERMGMSAEERRRLIRESWAKKFS